MEQALVDLYSCAEHQTYPGNIPLEFNLFKLASIPNLLQGMFYMFPLFHEGKLFIRYLETGSYSGFLDHILPLLKQQFSVPEVNILPWEIYTRKDLSMMGAKIGPTSQPATTYRRKFGSEDTKKSNQTCILALLNQNKPKVMESYFILFVHKAKANPQIPTHRYVKTYSCSPPTWGGTNPPSDDSRTAHSTMLVTMLSYDAKIRCHTTMHMMHKIRFHRRCHHDATYDSLNPLESPLCVDLYDFI